MAGSGVKNFFKYGCFGCAGLVLLAVVVLAVLSGTALFQSRVEQVEERELRQEFPRVATVSEEELASGGEGAAIGPRPGRVVLAAMRSPLASCTLCARSRVSYSLLYPAFLP